MAAQTRVDRRRTASRALVRKRVIGACAGIAALLLLTVPFGSLTPGPPPVSVVRPPVASPGLAFRMPSTKELRSSPRKVFAHYVPSLTVSLDNADPADDYYAREYLRPDGEHGAHAAYGGFLRDRPMTRPTRSGDWRLLDLEDEVRQAIAAGIDGFSVDLLQLPEGSDPRVAENVTLLLQAAHEVDPGFAVMLMPDLSGSLGNASQQDLASYLAQLAEEPSAYRLSDGRLMLSPFHAETHNARWWQQLMTVLKDQYGISVAFLPVFLDERGHVREFAPVSFGLSTWGDRNPVESDSASTLPQAPRGRIEEVHARGLAWMQPVSMQDERPRSGSYQEADGTANLRSSWRIAIAGNADLVQLATWNDYAEGTQLAPSLVSGWGPLDISAYYLVWFKTGTPPTILRDVLYVTHRTQPFRARPAFYERKLMALRGLTAPRDVVEGLAFLRQASVVQLTVGGSRTSCSLSAGAYVCTAPLRPGQVSGQVRVGSRVTAAVVSPYLVTAHPYVQDLHYLVAGSASIRPRVPSVSRRSVRTTRTQPPPAETAGRATTHQPGMVD